MSFEVILPFLKPIKHLLEAETVSEIMVNPDSFVQIDTRQTKISRDFVWKNKYERPIYFTELRDNQCACSWCQLDRGYLFLIPSPQSQAPIRQVRYPDDAEIVGRVTAITMRIAELRRV